MQYLLDTHAILWYVDANANLSLSLRDTIDSADCFYSVASLWEIAIKQSLGRLNPEIPISEYDSLCQQAGFHRLSILPQHLDTLKTLPLIHRDPFDRLLVAQAMGEGLVIVTQDRMIPMYPVQTLW